MLTLARICVIVAFAWFAHCSLRQVTAQAPESAVLTLAQAMVLEADWLAATDHAAIAHVLMREADRKGAPLIVHIKRYVAGFKLSLPRSLVIRGLSMDGCRPAGWPPHLSWQRHRAWWLATVARAQKALDGDLQDPCKSEAHHWGGDMDLHRAARAGWVKVDCGDTVNTFWRRP